MADYKILQNIDLAQNEIKEVSKISNDRTDNNYKGLLIQTGDDTSLTLNRKVGENSNYIKGIVKEGTSESIFNIEPSKIGISNNKGTEESSSLVLGLDADKKEHIKAISPLVDIKTGGADYTDPHISLKKEGSTLGLKSSRIEASSKKGSKSSNLIMEDTIVGVSQGITFKDKDTGSNVSLDLNTEGTISLEASKSISETVDKLSVSLDKSTIEGKATQTITIKNSEEEAKPSQIEIYDKGVKTSKGIASYVDLKESTLEEQSSTVIIKTPTNVTLELNETKNSATLDSKGTIGLTASTSITDTVSGEIKELENTEGTSTLTSTPSGISINSEVNEIQSTLSVGLDAKKKEHIEAVSPLVDIKTGIVDYTDPHISLSQNSLNLKSTEISLNSKGTTNSSLTMNGGITEESDTITFKSNSKYDTTKDYFTVSLNKTSDKGNVSLSAKDSITESIGNRSVSIGTSNIVIKDSTTSSTESKIEVNNSGIIASKGTASYVDLKETSLEEQSSTVKIKTPNNVTLKLEDNKKSATLSSKGTITLTSNEASNEEDKNKEASTLYGDNRIVSKADSIKLQTQGYEEKTEDTTKYFSHFPHIELTSKSDNKSILIEGKTIGISSKDKDPNTGDTISLTGTKLNVGSTTTEITSKDIKVQHTETVLKDSEPKEEDIIVLEINNKSDSKLIKVPTTTEVDINSTKIEIGDTNSTTTISGSELNVKTETNIEGNSTLKGTTTLQSSVSSPANTLAVGTTSTSITGLKAEINPTTVNIGTATNTEKSVVTTDITIGNNAGGTTKLASKTTSIISPELSVSSGTVKFTGSNISINNTKDDKGKETSSVSLTSNVNTSVKDKVFSVDKGGTPTLKVDTSSTDTSISLAGSSTTITSGSVGIGASDTTTGITIGNNVKNHFTTLQSNVTNITSPNINIGQTGTSTLNIGNTNATVIFEGNNNLSITSDTSTSNVTAKTLKFEKNISSNDIKIYWDDTSKSLVFAKV